MFLLDTNVLIYLSQGFQPVVDFVKKVVVEDDLALSVVAVSEFLVKATEDEKQALEQVQRSYKVFPVDLEIAKVAADYRRKYMRKKQEVFLLDCFIAATARVNKCTLLTHNTADYPMDDVEIIDPLGDV